MEAPDRCCDCNNNDSNYSYLDEEKREEKRKVRREAAFVSSAIGKEWLNNLAKLKKEKDSIIKHDLNCSQLIRIEEELNRHISSREILVDKAEEEYKVRQLEKNGGRPRIVNELKEEGKSIFLEQIFNKQAHE